MQRKFTFKGIKIITLLDFIANVNVSSQFGIWKENNLNQETQQCILGMEKQ